MPFEEDITRSGTLSPDYYFSNVIWEDVRERVFTRSWLFIGRQTEMLSGDVNLYPFSLIEDYLDEPLLLSKESDEVKCLSNVCTHRAFLLSHEPSCSKKIVCKYHGRKFTLDGKFESMPEFKEAKDFPRSCDDLAVLPIKLWRDFIFTGLDPAIDLNPILKEMDERLSFMPKEKFRFVPELSKTYEVNAHWALYVENYLEGFHIPFVHDTLNGMLDYSSYQTECSSHLVLQTGYAAKKSEDCFDLPVGHPDHGRRVTGYYYWLFPNLMFNFYPWGLQVNVVRPVSKEMCRVDFTYYIYDEVSWSKMDGEQIAEITQLEDEFVVKGVQKGLQSRLYPGGRFSPKREKGVHYFQKLLKEYLHK